MTAKKQSLFNVVIEISDQVFIVSIFAIENVQSYVFIGPS